MTYFTNTFPTAIC